MSFLKIIINGLKIIKGGTMVAGTKRTKEELQGEIKALEDRLNRLEKDLRTPLEADSTERATQMENREVLEQLERMAVQRLETLRQELNNYK